MPSFNGTLNGGACITPAQAAPLVCPGSGGFTVAQVSISLPGYETQYLCKRDTAFIPMGAVSLNCTITADDNSMVPTILDGLELGWSVGTVLIFAACIFHLKKALL
jgi:hypothetical protein